MGQNKNIGKQKIMSRRNLIGFMKKAKYLENIYDEYISLQVYENVIALENRDKSNGLKIEKCLMFTLFNLIQEVLQLEQKLTIVFSSESLHLLKDRDDSIGIEDAFEITDLLLKVGKLKRKVLLEFKLTFIRGDELPTSSTFDRNEQIFDGAPGRSSESFADNVDNPTAEDLIQDIQELNNKVLEVLACQKQQSRETMYEAILKEEIGKDYQTLLRNLELFLKQDNNFRAKRRRQKIVPFEKIGKLVRRPPKLDVVVSEAATVRESSSDESITITPQRCSETEVNRPERNNDCAGRRSICEQFDLLNRHILQAYGADLPGGVCDDRERPFTNSPAASSSGNGIRHARPKSPPPPPPSAKNQVTKIGSKINQNVEPAAQEQDIARETPPHLLDIEAEIVIHEEPSKQVDASDASTAYVKPTRSRAFRDKNNSRDSAFKYCILMDILERLENLRHDFMESIDLLVDLCERMQYDDSHLSSTTTKENVNTNESSNDRSSTSAGASINNQMDTLDKPTLPVSNAPKRKSVAINGSKAIPANVSQDEITKSSAVIRNSKNTSVVSDQINVSPSTRTLGTNVNRRFSYPIRDYSRHILNKVTTFVNPQCLNIQMLRKTSNSNQESSQSGLSPIAEVDTPNTNTRGSRNSLVTDSANNKLTPENVEKLSLNCSKKCESYAAMHSLPKVHIEERQESERNFLNVTQISEVRSLFDKHTLNKSNSYEALKKSMYAKKGDSRRISEVSSNKSGDNTIHNRERIKRTSTPTKNGNRNTDSTVSELDNISSSNIYVKSYSAESHTASISFK